MRIVGGRWRGRRLAAVGTGDPKAALRPTTDRVRESIFNLLVNAHGDPVTEATVLDAFAGTGALGLEALSRGAASATFVETGRPALALLRRNVETLEAEARVHARDALRPGPGTPHDLLFLDPPYGRGLGARALDALEAGGWVAPAATLVWEEASEQAPPPGWDRLDARRYGDTWITILGR